MLLKNSKSTPKSRLAPSLGQDGHLLSGVGASATPRELILLGEKGAVLKGPTKNPFFTSLSVNLVTISG